MNRIGTVRALAFASLFVAAGAGGCAKMQPGMGFDDVQREVSQRSGRRVYWNNGTEADKQAAAAVDGLLGEELTADGAVQVALLNNRELQAVYEELNIAQADLVQAGLLKNPVFSGEVRFATDGGGTAYVLDVAQDFVSLLSMPMLKGRAQAAFEAAKARVTGEVLDKAFEARTAFYDYQAAVQMREMRRTVMEAMEASYELAKRLRAAGNTRELDLSNERAVYEEAKVSLADSEAGVVLARERVNALMGLWGEQASAWRAAERLPDLPDSAPSAEGLEGRAIAASLDLSLLRRDAEIAARSAGIAKPFAWLDGAEVGAAAEREAEGPWTVGPSLSLPIPLFDQGQAKVGAAEARYRQASQRLYARAVEVRARVRAAYSGVVSAYERARYYERVILPLRAQIVEQTQLQYNAMQVSGFQLLQAKREQVVAGGEYIGAVHGYWEAKAAFDQVLSGRMTPFEGAGSNFTMTTEEPGAAGEGGHR